ncbi:MAG: hypothetical protein H6741_25050 [Alphaproteobacteria bacterium]|nr:hypothetical protein [Alphaproteobacteria bacterium]
MLVALLTLLGCRPAEALGPDCRTEGCLGAWAVQAWPEAPEQVLERLREEQDPSIRLTVAMAVIEAHPRTGSRVCRVLPQGPVSRRCVNIADRPHLWTVTEHDSSENLRFNGEAVHNFEVEILDPYAELEPLWVSCEGAPRDTCQADAALQAALQADMPLAARYCKGVGAGKWRSECFFDAAERLCGAARAGSCGGGARLCLGAGQFQVPCFIEIASEISRLAPPATATDREAWAPFASTLAQATGALMRDNPELARRFEARVWAGAISRAYATAPAVGNPMHHAPVGAKPHVRGAIARRLILDASAASSLDEWAEAVKAAEASESGPPESPLPRLIQPVGLWQQILPQERSLARIPYLGEAIRALHPDPELDRLICVLEAGARHPTPLLALLEEGARHPDRVVRWTAVRLLRAIAPEHLAVQRARQDVEPLVRARATADLAATIQ